MSKAHILVTGSSGYLGSNLLQKLFKNKDYELTALDIRNDSNLPKSVRFLKVDIGDSDLLNKAFNGVDLICHCASLGGTNYGIDVCTEEQIKITNIKGTQNLYEQAKNNGVNKIVLTSSIEVLTLKMHEKKWPIDESYTSNPDNLYGISKRSQEDIAKDFAYNKDVRTLALRTCAFFPLKNPEQGFRLTGTHAMIEDVVNAHIAAVKVLINEKKSLTLKKFEAIFITNKLPYQDQDKKLIDEHGKMKKLIKKYWPNHANYLFDLGYKKALLPGVYNLNKAKKILDWEPIFNFDQWLIS